MIRSDLCSWEGTQRKMEIELADTYPGELVD